LNVPQAQFGALGQLLFCKLSLVPNPTHIRAQYALLLADLIGFARGITSEKHA
jgi:hypothetical protein